MSDTPSSGNQPQQQQQIQLRIDEQRMKSCYANTIRTTTALDEVVLDFGMNMPIQGPEGQVAMLFDVGSRVVMNWKTAKRLAMSIGQVIRQYEQANGEINLSQQGAGPKLAK